MGLLWPAPASSFSSFFLPSKSPVRVLAPEPIFSRAGSRLEELNHLLTFTIEFTKLKRRRSIFDHMGSAFHNTHPKFFLFFFGYFANPLPANRDRCVCFLFLRHFFVRPGGSRDRYFCRLFCSRLKFLFFSNPLFTPLSPRARVHSDDVHRVPPR